MTEPAIPEIEFTDRYGGRTPSWLRSCHSDCEAMGVYPVFAGVIPKGHSVFPSGKLTDYEVEEINKHIEKNGVESDGWYFIKCPDCNGTGRVYWLVSVLRIPQWIRKGIKFCFCCYGNRDDWPWWKNFKLRFWCSFICDLKRLRN